MRSMKHTINKTSLNNSNFSINIVSGSSATIQDNMRLKIAIDLNKDHQNIKSSFEIIK